MGQIGHCAQDGARDEINIRRPKFNLVSIFANTQQHSGFKHKFTGKNNIVVVLYV